MVSRERDIPIIYDKSFISLNKTFNLPMCWWIQRIRGIQISGFIMQTVIALVDISSRTRSDRYHVVEKRYQSKGYGYLHKYAGSNPLYTNVSKFSHFAKSNLLDILLWKYIYILVKIIYMN